jgi:phage protein U
MYLLLATGFLAFTRNAWYLIPAAAGGWIGTFVTVKLEKRKADVEQPGEG